MTLHSLLACSPHTENPLEKMKPEEMLRVTKTIKHELGTLRKSRILTYFQGLPLFFKQCKEFNDEHWNAFQEGIFPIVKNIMKNASTKEEVLFAIHEIECVAGKKFKEKNIPTEVLPVTLLFKKKKVGASLSLDAEEETRENQAVVVSKTVLARFPHLQQGSNEQVRSDADSRSVKIEGVEPGNGSTAWLQWIREGAIAEEYLFDGKDTIESLLRFAHRSGDKQLLQYLRNVLALCGYDVKEKKYPEILSAFEFLLHVNPCMEIPTSYWALRVGQSFAFENENFPQAFFQFIAEHSQTSSSSATQPINLEALKEALVSIFERELGLSTHPSTGIKGQDKRTYFRTKIFPYLSLPGCEFLREIVTSYFSSFIPSNSSASISYRGGKNTIYGPLITLYGLLREKIGNFFPHYSCNNIQEADIEEFLRFLEEKDERIYDCPKKITFETKTEENTECLKQAYRRYMATSDKRHLLEQIVIEFVTG